MKKFTLTKKDYTFKDLFMFPLKIAPIWIILLTVIKTAFAFLPAVQIIALSNVVNTALTVKNGVGTSKDLSMPVVLLLCVIGLFSIKEFVVYMFEKKLQNMIKLEIQWAITEKRSSLKYEHMEESDTNDAIIRAGTDTLTMFMQGYNAVMEVVSVVISVASVLWMIMTVLWWAGLLIVAISIPLFVFSYKSGQKKYVEEKGIAYTQRKADYYRELMYDRTLLEERSIFDFTKYVNRVWYDENLKMIELRMKARRTNYFSVKTGAFLMIITMTFIVATLLIPLQNGLLSLGMFIGLFTGIITIVQSLGWQISWVISMLSATREQLKDVELLANLSEKEAALKSRIDISDFEFEQIEFRDVSFAYPKTDRLILEHFNFTFEAGKNYAIVGLNGAGKTTLTKLICGLYDNYSGEILLNGRELHTYPFEFMKSILGVVYQDFTRYQISLKENLLLGNINSVSDRELYNILDMLKMTSWVESLPQGIDTVLGKIKDDATDLSGGQWQKIAIARCLIAPVCMRILDEPTAALDPVAESEIYSIFSQIIKGRSSVIITHRLGAARIADEIVMLSNGNVMEHGSHETLMNHNGFYAELFESQKEWYS
ncbi:MAG: ABC transporter ATP-binding protein [Lachnospiraceae bacterium]